MKWLLDTNVVSETVRPRPDKAVLRWLGQRSPDQLAISIVTMAELRDGAELASSERRRRELLAWLDTHVTESFRKRTLPLNAEILVDWLRLSRRVAARGRPREPVDLLIAATARTHDLILVSRNRRDFENTGVVLCDPWTGDTHKMEAQ